VLDLILIDHDKVGLSNLHRQIQYTEKDIGKIKARVTAINLKKIDKRLKIKTYIQKLTKDNTSLLKGDLILDCTDNLDVSFIINDYAKKHKIPWIFASCVSGRGQCLVIMNKTPCLKCILRKPTVKVNTCNEEGILNTIVSTMANVQVTEAIKILTKQKPCKDLICYDIWNHEVSKIKIKKKPSCCK